MHSRRNNFIGDRRSAAAKAASKRLGKRTAKPTVEELLSYGGKDFVENVEKYGYNDRQSKIRLTPWYRELLELVGNLNVHEVYVTGCAQAGKTAACTLLSIYLLAKGVSFLWAYAQLSSLMNAVPLQFRPMVEQWLKAAKVRAIGSQKLTLYQVSGANGIFTYVSTNKSLNMKEGGAAAGTASVSVTADVLFREERSQYAMGAGDPLSRRIDASLVPTKPTRDLGTPGSGGGIEAEIAKCKNYFYAHFQCSKCGEISPLDPKGCLLKPVTLVDTIGKERVSYLSPTGRPIDWYNTDPKNPVDTAYFACPHCGEEIPDDARTSSWYKCVKTGIDLREFLDTPIERGRRRVRQKAGISISPLLRITEHNLAAEIISGGLETTNVEDWQQQVLGHPSTTSGNSISIDAVCAAIASPCPEREPDYIIAGIDMGRGEDWFVAVAIYLPEETEGMNDVKRFDRAIRKVIFGGDILRSRIPELLDTYNVVYGLIDNEPSREKSMEICRETCLEMADQIGGLRDAVRKVIVSDGGEQEECWDIRNEKFMQAVVDGFLTLADDGYPIYRLPFDWENWLGKNTERSPIRHLCAPYRDPVKGWQRAKDGIDDLFFALVFAEAAFYLHLTNTITYRSGMF